MVLPAAHALESLTYDVRGEDSALKADIVAVSQINAAKTDNRTEAQDILAAADTDYGRIVGLLYARGYYGGVVRILIDGREAAGIEPLAPPARIDNVVVSVDPGRVFRFGTAQIDPLVRGTRLPEGFARGQIAGSEVASEATAAAAREWRRAGYAKVRVSEQSFIADHARHILAARLRLAPGPVVHFGQLVIAPGSAVRDKRIRQIAGLPTGKLYSPDTLDTVAERLRRTGAFRSVILTEAETLGAGNTLDMGVELEDEKPRRIGFGGEIATDTGLSLSAFWLHRNLLGGAERLRLGAEVSGVGVKGRALEYNLSVRYDRPASYGPDTAFYALGQLERQDRPSYRLDQASLEIGASRIFSKQVNGSIGFGLKHARVNDAFGKRAFTYLTMPTLFTWDYRDDKFSPTKGWYFDLSGIPYVGFGGSKSGAQFKLDGRTYRSFGADDRFVAAARFQLGSVIGSDIASTPPDMLFYSGGGGTVRGHSFQSLGVDQGGGKISGGRTFLGLSVEMRARVSSKVGLVGFVDAGYIGAESLYDGSGNWHSGAGVGLRYDTFLGPIRLDAAVPLGGKAAKKVQVYVGIGQSF